MTLSYLFAVGIAGFVGAIARFYISEKWNNKSDGGFPYGTLSVNLLGSFLLGIIIGINMEEFYLIMIGTGLLGAFTTFSTFNKELYTLQKNPMRWLLYFSTTYIGGLAVAYIGYMIGQ